MKEEELYSNDLNYLNRFRNVYIGICATNAKSKNQKEYEFFVPNLLPEHIGNFGSTRATNTIAYYDMLTGSKIEMDIHSCPTIPADYLGVDTNRSVPVMYKGLMAILFSYGSGERWYWVPLSNTDSQRTVEHIRWSVSDDPQRVVKANQTKATDDNIENNTENSINGLTDQNTYYIEMNTKWGEDRYVKISTCHSAGEAYDYEIVINTTKSNLSIKDFQIGPGKTNQHPQERVRNGWVNGIEMNSVTPSIEAWTRDGAGWRLWKDNIHLFCPNSMVMDIGNKLITKVNGEVTHIFGETDEKNVPIVPPNPELHKPEILNTTVIEFGDKTAKLPGVFKRFVKRTYTDLVGSQICKTMGNYIRTICGFMVDTIQQLDGTPGSRTSTVEGPVTTSIVGANTLTIGGFNTVTIAGANTISVAGLDTHTSLGLRTDIVIGLYTINTAATIYNAVTTHTFNGANFVVTTPSGSIPGWVIP